MSILKKLQIVLLILVISFTTLQVNSASAIESRKVNVDELLYKVETPGSSTDTRSSDYIKALPSGSAEIIISKVVFFILIIANILAFVSFLAAGVFMLISQGHEDDLTKAKRMFQYTVIAMIICATALALVTGLTKLRLF
jgi:hypothetical protein